MPPTDDNIAVPSPGGESVVSSKREASPDPADEAARNGKKKKTGAGNRGVANLTAEQLQKKRENGR